MEMGRTEATAATARRAVAAKAHGACLGSRKFVMRGASRVGRVAASAWRMARGAAGALRGCGGGVPTWVAAKLTIDMVRMAVVA